MFATCHLDYANLRTHNVALAPVQQSTYRFRDSVGRVQNAAQAGMQHAMQHGQPSGLQRVAQLLCGHQTAAAAVLAASMGDVRLASLIAQVSHSLTDIAL